MNKHEDYLIVVIKKGILLIVTGLVLGLVMLLIGGLFSNDSKKIFEQSPFTAETAHASVLNWGFKRKPKIKPLKITDDPQKVTVQAVAGDNSLVVKGKYTTTKRVQLYLASLPPQNLFMGDEAHRFLKAEVTGKQVYVFTDDQAPKVKYPYVYIQKGNHLVQSTLLRKGYAVMYNYNGSEKYYRQLLKDQEYGQQHSKGVWLRNGYVTDGGYSKKAGQE